MTEATSLQLPPALASAAADRVVRHLLRYPADLIDIRHLMHRFEASTADVQQVFRWLEQKSPPAVEAASREGQPESE